MPNPSILQSEEDQEKFDYKKCPECGSTKTYPRLGNCKDSLRVCPNCALFYDYEKEYKKFSKK